MLMEENTDWNILTNLPQENVNLKNIKNKLYIL